MDNLTKDALCAHLSGMSYGRWKAKQYQFTQTKKETPPPGKYQKVCPGCDLEFSTNRKNKIYCCYSCYIKVNNARSMARLKKAKEEAAKCQNDA